MKQAPRIYAFTLSIVLSIALSMVVVFARTASADDRGTQAEAKAMLDRAVAAIKTDKAGALAMFSKGEGGFKDRDLYVFCGGTDGTFTAHPSLIGKSMRGLMDKGTPPMAIGEALYKAGEAGGGEVKYLWPRPGGSEPMTKIAIVAKADDQICAVGYYP